MKNTVEIKIKNCRNCTFCTAEFDPDKQGTLEQRLVSAFCFAPSEIHHKYDVDSYWKSYKKPNWCPLNKNILIITS